MSSYLSQQLQYNNSESAVNLPLVANVLQVKEAKYTQNKQRIASTLDMYGNMDLLRDQDKEYLAGKLNDVTSLINNSANRDLSMSYISDDIYSSVKRVAADPVILDAIASTQNKARYDAQAAEAKKGKNGEFNLVNYQDGLKQGGFQDYMAGKTNKLGSMQYTNYVDVPSILNEKVSKWAKDNGHTDVSLTDAGLYDIKTKKQILTKEEIASFIGTQIDPTIKSQMAINARYQYDNMSDAEFNNVAKQKYTVDSSNYASKIAEQKAYLATATTDDQKKIIEENINDYHNQKKEVDDKIAKGVYDRQDKYQFYTKDLIYGIASSYDKNEVLDVEYDTTKLQLAKFQEDVRHHKADELMRAYALDKKNSKGQDISSGTAIPTTPEAGLTEAKSDEQVVKEGFLQTNAELKTILAKEDPMYKSLNSDTERNNYIRNLMKQDITVNLKSGNPMSAAVINAVNNHRNNYQAYSEHVRTVATAVNEESQKQYESMRGASGLNLRNLQTSMPYTASALAKNVPFERLSPANQDVIRFERVANQLKFDDNLNDDERQNLNSYLNRLKIKNKGSQFFKDAVRNVDTEEVGGIFQNIGRQLGLGASQLGNIALKTKLGASYLLDTAFSGERAAKENIVKGEGELARRYAEQEKEKKRLGEFERDYFNPMQDTNITEVDVDSDTRTHINAATDFRDNLSRRLAESRDRLKSYVPTMPEKIAYSFSTANENQKGTALEIGQAVMAQNPDLLPISNNNFKLDYIAKDNAFNVTYLAKDGKEVKQTTATIPAAMMPQNIRNQYQTSLSNWSTDVHNPKASIPQYEHIFPKSIDDANNMEEQLRKIGGDSFSSEEIINLGNSFLFLAPNDRLNAVKKEYPEIFQDKNKSNEALNAINAKIRVETKVIQGRGFQLTPIATYPDGSQEKDTSLITVVPSYDANTNLKMQIELASAFMRNKLSNLAKD